MYMHMYINHLFSVYIYIHIHTFSRSGRSRGSVYSVLFMFTVWRFVSKAPKGKSRTSKPCPYVVFGTGDDGR